MGDPLVKTIRDLETKTDSQNALLTTIDSSASSSLLAFDRERRLTEERLLMSYQEGLRSSDLNDRSSYHNNIR